MKKELCIFNGASRAAAYGIGTYIDQLLKALKDTEWELTVVYLYAQGDEIEITEKEGYRQINIPSPSGNHPNAKQYYPKAITCLLKDILPLERGTKRVFHLNFMSNYELVKSLKKHFRCKILLVAHYTNWSFSLLGDRQKLKKLLQKPKKELEDPLEKSIVEGFKEDIKMIKRVDRLVCVANHTCEALQSEGAVPANKIEIINNAIEDSYKPLSGKRKSKLRSKYYIDDNIRVLLFAGRLDDVKGIVWLIRAFRKVLKTNPDICLIIAGEGNFNVFMKEAANAWSRIVFTGRLDKKTLFELYQIADMGVVCSLHEEFGLVAIEMMMHALPVIVTQTGGLDEIVEDGVSGLKVPVRNLKGARQVDVKQLEAKIQFILDNPVLAQGLGKNGRKRFLDKYELSLFREKMLNLYERL